MGFRQIASALAIKPFTVRKHRSNILAKLGLHSTAQLVAHAIGALPVSADPGPPAGLPAESGLSEREKQVIRLISRGLTSKEVARELGISPLTVRKHRENAMRKLAVHGMAGLINWARTNAG